jgi:hypothetical protein
VQYSPAVLKVIVNETIVSHFFPRRQPYLPTKPHKRQFWGSQLAKLDNGTTVSIAAEPFDAGLFNHSIMPSAYPPDRSRPLFPTNLYFGWTKTDLDADIANALRQSSDAVRAAAVADGQGVANAFVYGNYALFGTPVEAVYGANVPRLREIRSRIDPCDVMGLAGGFKF